MNAPYFNARLSDTELAAAFAKERDNRAQAANDARQPQILDSEDSLVIGLPWGDLFLDFYGPLLDDCCIVESVALHGQQINLFDLFTAKQIVDFEHAVYRHLEAPESDDADDICDDCAGTGEGTHDGATCGHCGGSGLPRATAQFDDHDEF